MNEQLDFRLGMVGCGGISNAHARAAQNIPTVRFAACCDIREDVAEAWANRYGCDAVYTDYVEMIRQEDLDGVLLATWPNQHRGQIEGCLEAGARNILCEKALTLTGQEALEIFQMVREADAFVMEGFMYRNHPAIRKIESRLASGELGAVDNVRACFHAFDSESADPNDPNRNWRRRKECGGGIPYDFACYCVNACQLFSGGIPTRVYCRGDESAKYGTVNRMYGLIEYDNGCVGIVESSKKASLSQELQITCAHGTLHLPVAWSIYDDVTLTQRQSQPWPSPVADAYHILKANSYQLQLENFAGVVRGEAEPGMPLATSVVNTYTTEALVTSLLERRLVEVDIPAAIREEVLQ
jgi:predicted dehydrogenase